MGNDSFCWSDSSCIFEGANLKGARATGATPGIKLIWNSTWQTGGRPSRLLLVASPLFLQFLVWWPTLLQGGSISCDGFLPSILLLVMIIVAVIVVIVVIVVIENYALSTNPLASRLWWWLPTEFDSSK
ncbi:hypothetical protein Tco_0976508 [Tanacetum coccineum]|uniref:Uncharacterized protein n=1 Tax=Tanacetum coccineum TaxID=301880 RepID=A0ABQ5EHJ3_9ASTR